jgi:FkbM family methyltransferase
MSYADDRVTGPTTADLLRMYDLSLLDAAAAYDLRQASERARSTQELERLFFRLVEILAPQLFIEAGAKDAGSSRRARECLENARIVAFEANPYTYRRFKKRNKRSGARVEYLHKALSDAPGTATFHVMQTPDGRPSADGQGSLIRREDDARGEVEVSVPCTTLDEFFADHAYETCALWIDVEGASRQVLRGGREVLSTASVAIIEVEDRRFWTEQWLAFDVLRAFFEVEMVPVARDFQSRHQYNVVFVRDALLSDHRVRAELAMHRSGASHGDGRSASARPNGGYIPDYRAMRKAARNLWRRVRAAAQRAEGADDLS